MGESELDELHSQAVKAKHAITAIAKVWPRLPCDKLLVASMQDVRACARSLVPAGHAMPQTCCLFDGALSVLRASGVQGQNGKFTLENLVALMRDSYLVFLQFCAGWEAALLQPTQNPRRTRAK